MRVIEVDFSKCSTPGCDGWDNDEGGGGCPLLPCQDIAKEGIVIIKSKDTHLPTDEEVAQAFHEAYERFAPEFGYKTREASAKPWADVPENNKKLMIATVRAVCRDLAVVPRMAECAQDDLRDGASPWG